MREFTHLAEAASSRIAFQGVDRAANTPEVFFVARTVFERETSFVHGLEDLRGTLEKEIAELRGALVGEKGH
jgi:hypothetical protein